MRKMPRWPLVVVAGVALVAVLRFWVLRPRPLEVAVAQVEVGEVEETITNTRAGTVKARLRARLSPQIGGRVVTLPYREGSHVEAGELLLQLDDSIQRAHVELALEDVRTAQARSEEVCLAAELAEREWRRGVALLADGITSEQLNDALESERDRGQAACQAAQAATGQAQARLRLARAELALTEIRAPFAGVVAECAAEVGEWITPSPPALPIPPVLDLLGPTSIFVSAPIDEVDAERVAVGQEVRIRLDSRPGVTFAGRLVRVAPYVLDALEQNRTVEVEAELTDPSEARSVLPGTSADVEVILTRLNDVVRVPTAAIAEGGRVLVLAGGTLHEREIETGLRNWRFTQVTAGLSRGELVVTSRDSTAIRGGARAIQR